MPHPKPIHISWTFFRCHQGDTRRPHGALAIDFVQSSLLAMAPSFPATLHRGVSLLLFFFLGFWWSCWIMAHDGRPFEAHQKKKINGIPKLNGFFGPNMRIPDPHICFSKKNAFGHKWSKRVSFKTVRLPTLATELHFKSRTPASSVFFMFD